MQITARFAGMEPVLLLNGALLLEPMGTLVVTELDDGVTWEIDVMFDDVLNRYVAEKVTVIRPGSGTEVTSRVLRDVRVQETIQASLGLLIKVRDDRGEYVDGADALLRVAPAEGRPRADVERDAALIFIMADIANLPPVKAVADRLGVSISTAARWLKPFRGKPPAGTPVFGVQKRILLGGKR